VSKTFNSKIGCEEGQFFLLTEASTGDTYGDPIAMAALKTAALAIAVAEAQQYGDDVMVDKISLFTSGTLTEQSAGELESTVALLNGKTVDADDEIADSVNDTIPAFGHSFLSRTRRKTASGVEEGYTAYFYTKVKYAPIAESITGKADNVTYSVTDLTATVFANNEGVWRYTKSFFGATALADARKWILTKAGQTPIEPEVGV
jgi:hypothetical protein